VIALGHATKLGRLFVSAIAHDLRTPLFMLRGHLKGLERGVAATSPPPIDQPAARCSPERCRPPIAPLQHGS